MRSFPAIVRLILAAPFALPASAGAADLAASDRNGVVAVEQAGKLVALGTVLNGDGRVVTALSRLSEQLPVFLRYANGKLEVARVGHSDRSRDLALLVPKTARWQQGFKASRNTPPPASTTLTAFSVGPNRTLAGATRTLKAGAGRALTLDSAAKPEELGGPLLDTRGEAVAIVVSGCAGASTPAPCTAPPIALPVAEVRTFLRALPPEAALAAAWLGIQGMPSDTGVVRGLRITHVEPGSPAALLKLRAGSDFATSDLLVAIAGEPVPTSDALRGVLTRYGAGDRVDLLLFGNGSYRSVTTRLADRPAGQSTAARAAEPSSSSAQPAAGSKAK